MEGRHFPISTGDEVLCLSGKSIIDRRPVSGFLSHVPFYRASIVCGTDWSNASIAFDIDRLLSISIIVVFVFVVVADSTSTPKRFLTIAS